MRISLKSREMRVAHPVHPEVVVTMKRLTNEQRMILTEQGVRTIQRAMKAEMGGDLSELVMPEMLGSIKATLKVAVTQIEGLTDDDGNTVTLTPENFEAVLDSLWGSDFIIPDFPTVDSKTGETKASPIQFPTWLVTKQSEAASWAKDDLDPKEQQPQ